MDRSIAHNLLKRLKQKPASYINKTRAWYNRRSIVSKVKGFRAWLSSEGVEYVTYLKSYAAYLVIYGLLLNYALHILLSYPLSYQTVPAWGITYYFVKEEATEIITFTVRRSRGLE